MNYNKALFIFIFGISSFSFLFSMEGEFLEVPDERKVTRGQLVYEGVVGYISAENDQQDVIIDNVATNLINVSLQKADRSVEGITEELGTIKPVAYIAQKIASGFISGAKDKKADVISQVKEALKLKVGLDQESDLISSEEILKVKTGSSQEGSCVSENAEFNPSTSTWVTKRLHANFDIEADQDSRKILFDVLCFAMHFARIHKEVFKGVISDITPWTLRWLVKFFSDVIHEKLVKTIVPLEKQMRIECLDSDKGPEEEQEGE